MNSFSEFVQKAKSIAKEYPIHRKEIFDFISLCESEIEEGGSVQHEIELAYNDICELVEITP
jgi:hypothetical protein